ncbi:trypsin-like peptidase domain-containing protein [Lewinella sp. JB7]|uniref:trypsin-like peptidase domain-containing protein n=1 Tax=Lewinella sp. JB7 TaxID=2962887 RepID=UPI0020C9DE55|nr:trypsin-like peptidase domain-containing protein [Lewinella sp. JB7]MCP9237782.1 trypsin-like peptidase domain-containing protein [Lewinella sp. JB7]
MNPRSLAVLLLACFLSAAAGVFGTARYLAPTNRAPVPADPSRDDLRLRTFASSSPTSFISAAERVTPAVVFVRSYLKRSLLSDLQDERTTTGSAVIVSPDGFIATNNHVIEGARRIRITLQDRREFDAEVIGVDESTDLALLKIDAENLPNLMFGNSDSLRVGEWVMAVGNPFSLNSTVTAGIVSAKGRSIDVLEPDDRIESFIQTDAAVNPGNSGGALINTAGELIGINTAIITNSGRHEGFAFAIPGNLANRVIRDLRDYGEVKRAVLGVWIQGINDAQAKQLNLPAARGALITNLTPEGPAARAGLQVGDVMTAINGVEINSSPQMQEQLSRYRPGQRIRVTYIRNGAIEERNILLRDKSNRPGQLVGERSDDLLHRLGFEVRGLTPSELRAYGAGGVRVISIFRHSPVESANMETGFVIQSVNGERVSNLDQFLRLLRRSDRPLLGGLYDGYEGEYFYRLEP